MHPDFKFTNPYVVAHSASALARERKIKTKVRGSSYYEYSRRTGVGWAETKTVMKFVARRAAL